MSAKGLLAVNWRFGAVLFVVLFCAAALYSFSFGTLIERPAGLLRTLPLVKVICFFLLSEFRGIVRG